MSGWEFWVPVGVLCGVFYLFMVATIAGGIDRAAGREKGHWRDSNGPFTPSHWALAWPLILPGLILAVAWVRGVRPLLRAGERIGELAAGRRP